MTRDDDLPGCAVFVALFALGWGAAYLPDCSTPGEGRVQERGDDLRARPASSAAGEERQVADAAGPLTPPEPAQRFRGAGISAVDLPGPASLSPVADRLRVTAALVDARCYQLFGFVVGGPCLCDLDSQVRQFDGAGEVVGLAEMSNQHENE